jgi:hypothetical protein
VSRSRGGQDSFACERGQASNSHAPAATEQSDELAAAVRQIGGGEPPPARSLAALGRVDGRHAAVVLLACGQVERAERRRHAAHDRSLTDGQLGWLSRRFIRPSAHDGNPA